ARPAEKDGTRTNTHRLRQFHQKAAHPPGDARSDLWLVYPLGRRLQELYRDSARPQDEGLRHLTWEYPPQHPDPQWRINDEPSAEAVLKEINGFTVADRAQVPDFAALKDDGSTACGGWSNSGAYPQ